MEGFQDKNCFLKHNCSASATISALGAIFMFCGFIVNYTPHLFNFIYQRLLF